MADDEFILEEVVELEKIPDGEILQAEVVKVGKQTKPWKDDDGNDVVRVNFEFRVTEEGPFFGRRVWGETPTTFSTHSDCKLRVWIQELLGEDDLPKGFNLKTSMVEGLPCRIAVAQRTNQTTKKTTNFVADVIRAARTPAAADVF